MIDLRHACIINSEDLIFLLVSFHIHSKPIGKVKRIAKEYPGKRVQFMCAIVEGNYVVVLHCYQEWPGENNNDWAGIDIFQLYGNSKIVEHWVYFREYARKVPNNANDNTKF